MFNHKTSLTLSKTLYAYFLKKHMLVPLGNSFMQIHFKSLKINEFKKIQFSQFFGHVFKKHIVRLARKIRTNNIPRKNTSDLIN